MRRAIAALAWFAALSVWFFLFFGAMLCHAILGGVSLRNRGMKGTQ